MKNVFLRVAVVLLGVALLAGAGAQAGGVSNAAPQADAPPTPLDVAHAAAPLFDDPVWHGASDPYVIWMPGKGDDHAGEWWMYYTQRRATLLNPQGVDWVHGSAIGIAASKDGRQWKYLGVCQGDQAAAGDNALGDPVKAKLTWWAPTYLWEGKTLHMFVAEVHGIFTTWNGDPGHPADRTIEHFTSEDGIHFKYVSTCTLSSMKCIDPMVLKIDDTYYMWYKDEGNGSHTWMAHSANLNDWTVDHEVVGGTGHEAPFAWKWGDKYYLIVDGYGKGLRIYESDTGKGKWTLNNTILSKADGTRTDDNSTGYHPAIVMQGGAAGGEQCILFYFTQFGKPTFIQMAELTIDAAGKVQCERNKYAATAGTNAAISAATQGGK